MESFVLECSGKQSGVRLRIRLDGLTKARVGGRDEVRVIVSFSVHDLMKESKRVTIHSSRVDAGLKWNVSIAQKDGG